MANQYFKNFPEIQYTLSDGKIVYIKDFFRKSKIDQEAVAAITDYEKYYIKDGERPDVLADKFYGNSDLHWVFFMVNDLENYYDCLKIHKCLKHISTKSILVNMQLQIHRQI